VTHLFALQFQGQFWTQKNGKDWTPFAFLSSTNGDLGLDVAADQETKRAIQECLRPLLKIEVDVLRAGKLEAADFRAIVTPDPARTLLRWMSDPTRVKQEQERSGSRALLKLLSYLLSEVRVDGRKPSPEGRNWSAGVGEFCSVGRGGAEEWETGDRENKQVGLALIEGWNRKQEARQASLK